MKNTLISYDLFIRRPASLDNRERWPLYHDAESVARYIGENDIEKVYQWLVEEHVGYIAEGVVLD